MSVLIALVFVFFTVFLYWCYGIYRKNKRLEKIPGPPPIPFFGTKLATDIYGLYTMFDELFEKYGKTCKIYVGESLQVVTKDINLIEPLLKSNVHITKSEIYKFLGVWLKDGLIISTGDKWKNRRRLCTPAFHFRTMREFFTIFKESSDIIIKRLGDAADKGKIINVIEYSSKFALDVVGESSFGVKLNIQNGDRKEYIQAASDILTIVYNKNFSPWKRFSLLFKLFSPKSYALQEKSLHILDTTAMNIIKDKRVYYKNNPSINTEESKYKRKCVLVEALMQHEELSDEDILEEVNNFLFAGHDTTAGGIAHSCCELAKHPDIQERLYDEIISYIQNDISNLTHENLQEMKYLDMVVKELLRLRSPVPLIERQLTEDALLGDILYPKGTTISILLYWLHHDSDLYPEPEKFDPERFSPENQAKRSPFAFVPFSAGPRNCIGQKYAIMEMKTVIIRIILEFIIHPVKDFKLELGMSSILRSKHGYPIKLERRNKV